MNEAHLSLSSTVVLTPRRAGLRAGSDNTLDVLVRVQAADAPLAGPMAPPAAHLRRRAAPSGRGRRGHRRRPRRPGGA
ncbi:MAG: hypothetical protein IPM15_08975 [Betaproteobacteria bacterium]|nr:hypothetical protein [Betaproteobacteria bacterium]